MKRRVIAGCLTMMLAACGRSEPPPVAPAAPRTAAAPAPAPRGAPEQGPSAKAAGDEAGKLEARTEEGAEAAKPEAAAEEAPHDEAGGAEAAGDAPAGKLILHHERPASSAMRELAGTLRESKLFEELLGSINSTFIFPRDVAVHFEDCGEANAFYDPEAKKISMCWELLEHTVKQFAEEDDTEEEATLSFLHATVFTFFHELGHALIDILDLPVTGREEDVVDQLATWILVVGGPDGALAAINGARSFLSEEEDDEPAHWGEHSLDKQRFYNIVCWVYGSDPERYAELSEAADGPLPEARAERCNEEWSRMSGAWTRILNDHVRE